MANSQVQPGDILAGKYQVERVLGVGGMGIVVSAVHLQLRERVALKFLLADALESPEIVERFGREARAAVRIKSEHVARVIDVGVLPNGAPFMVMEYLEGADLSVALAKDGSFSVRDAADCVLQASVAVAEAHSHGIIHRDLKPANLFRVKRRDGHPLVKVLDFGISKLGSSPGETSSSATKTTAVMGSPSYMSPEQMRSSKSVDERSDIWALGVILYELTTGKRAFDGEAYPDICLKVVSEDPPPMSLRVANVPPGFEAVVMRCLAKKREDRFQNVGELARALAPFASKEERSLVDRICGSLSSGASGGVWEARPESSMSAVPAVTGVPQAAAANGRTLAEHPSAPPGGTGRAWGQPTSATNAAAMKKHVPALILGGVGVLAIAAAVAFGLRQRDSGSGEVSRGLHEAPATAAAASPVTGLVAPPAPLPHVDLAIPVAAPIAPLREESLLQPAVSPSVASPAPVSPPTPAAVTMQGKRSRPTPAGPAPVMAPATPTTQPKAATPAAAAADPCATDYYYDDNGKKVFKKECFK